MKTATALSMLLALTGCAATMINLPGNIENPNAPTNEQSLNGLIKYPAGRSASATKRFRENAYKQMQDACGGRYTIVSEGLRAEGGTKIDLGDGDSTWVQKSSWYITFSCVRS